MKIGQKANRFFILLVKMPLNKKQKLQAKFVNAWKLSHVYLQKQPKWLKELKELFGMEKYAD